MATLAEIRAKLLAQESRSTGSKTSGGDNAIFPHWNIPEGTNATLRFLPDLDENNTFFWKERQMIRLPFSGVKGGDEHKSVTVQVPCVEMWGDSCPIHAEIRPWFKDPSMEDTARKYWKKRSYVFQGFVTQSELQEDNAPENPIRRFIISPQIFKIISQALMDPDFPEIPTDYESGTDFRVVKSTKGQYADYSTSNWARRERSLNQEERDAIANNGLFTLNDYLPKKPNTEELNAIFEMFEASVDGQLYDPERFADYYRPYGVDIPNSNGSTGTNETTPSTTVTTPPITEKVNTETVQEKVAEPEMATANDSDSKPSAQDILAMIRSRKED